MRQWKTTGSFYLFIAPWLFGFLLLTAGPMLFSLYLSFTEWAVIGDKRWIGLENYQQLMIDPLFWKALWNTFYYTLVSVPLGLAAGYLLAVLLNTKVKGMGLFRTLFYLPAIVPAVAGTLMWLLIFNPSFGLANTVLSWLHLPISQWFLSEGMVKPTLIIISLWSVGGSMVIYLAGLQDIPATLYEAADIDGANEWVKFWNITVPLSSHVIFFNFIIGLIGAFQVFTQSYLLNDGGPNRASLFLVQYLYENAFKYFKMGYASSLAWVLFVIILVFTLVQFKLFARKVYYETDE